MYFTYGICVCNKVMWCVSEKSNLFLKDPTDLMTNMYGDTVVTTNGEHAHAVYDLSVI